MARKLQQAANKAKVAQVKATARAAKEMSKAAELAAVASRFKWTEEASLELLAFVKMIKEEHDELSVKQPGFTTFSKYFLQNDDRKDEFPLLIKIENDTMIRRYRVLMNTFRQVRDYADTSGSGGLFAALLKCGLTESVSQRAPYVAGAPVPDASDDGNHLPPEICDPHMNPGAISTQDASNTPGTLTQTYLPVVEGASPSLMSPCVSCPEVLSTTTQAVAPQLAATPARLSHPPVTKAPPSVAGSRPPHYISASIACRQGKTEASC
ncbi:hypothetical protein VP01_3973g7 [Puccinia sorghi]|uniref:Uncharacterized protein n=1 Tax=Puccinia sorghi TaxID=27349 RepID=A0A0L6US77_9BASI|nr:hypothetical protein VP01_3973g7 [Puccinia sorghi]